MTDRDRLIEIISQAKEDEYISMSHYDITAIADYLLANNIIVPPCKVGDTVYTLREVSCEDIDGANTECEYYGFGTDDRICTLEKPQKCPYRYRIFKSLVTEYNLLSFARQWGKTVFLTREEAEKVLLRDAERSNYE